MTTAKTSTERGAAFKARRTAEGLHEVRGIWAPKNLHELIKEFGASAVTIHLAKRRIEARAKADFKRKPKESKA